jgi:DivIVA domain-containing protein
MILLLEVLAVLAVVFGVAVVLTGRSEGLSVESRDFADTGIPRDRAMTPADVVGLRFALAFRGYRMSEVDDALDRLAAELAARDEAIAALRAPVPAEPPAAPMPPPPPEPVAPPEPEPPTAAAETIGEWSLPSWPEPTPVAPPEPEPEPQPEPEPAPVTETLPQVEGEAANPFRPVVPDIPAYDPWAVTPRSRYTDGPTYVEVEPHDEADVEAIAEHHTGHAPAPDADEPEDGE